MINLRIAAREAEAGIVGPDSPPEFEKQVGLPGLTREEYVYSEQLRSWCKEMQPLLYPRVAARRLGYRG